MCAGFSMAISTESNPHRRKRGNRRALVLVNGAANRKVLMPKRMANSICQYRDKLALAFDELSDDLVGQPETFRNRGFLVPVEEHHADAQDIAGAGRVYLASGFGGRLNDE